MTKKIDASGVAKRERRTAPKQHQWPKGTSGNPKGRPKKAAAEPLDADVADMLVSEGLKPITVMEGGKPQSMPAIQAVTRAQLVSALKGNSHAMRSYIQQIANAQAQQRKRKEEIAAAAFGLRLELEIKRREWVSAGNDESELPLHPSDIEIDVQTGEVRYFLAFTEQERRGRASLVRFRDYLLELIDRGKVAAAEDGDDVLLEIARDTAHGAILQINEKLPSRLRRPPRDAKLPVTLESSPEELWRILVEPVLETFGRVRDGRRVESRDSPAPAETDVSGAAEASP